MKRILHQRGLSILVRISLGGIFVYASWSKLGDPPAFAQLLYNYKLLPSALINPLALTLPWLELLTGMALIAGVLRRGSALLISCMLAVFAAAIAINLARGNPIDCGCFSVGAVQKSAETLLAEMRSILWRDVGMLAMALQVLTTPVTWKQ